MFINIYYLLILLIVSILIIAILIKKNKQTTKTLEKTILDKHKIEVLRKDELKEYFKEEWDNQEQKLKERLQFGEKEIALRQKSIEQNYELQKRESELKLQNLETKLKEKEKRYNEVNQDLDLYRQGKMKEIDGTAAEYEQRKRTEIEQILKQKELQANSDFNNHVDAYIAQKAQMQADIETIRAELEEERNKRAAINEEILRQKKLEEQQDFFRIQLNPDDSNDIELLRSITPRLRHPEAINKVIWTGYYQKPLAELRKRILTNGDVSGVYKITRLKTNEIYIGQTTSVDKRWQEHVKSALGVGTLASSQLHRVMRSDGPENFTFELLEEVPKDKLRERESYYIDFYDSKTYGLNSVTGDKK